MLIIYKLRGYNMSLMRDIGYRQFNNNIKTRFYHRQDIMTGYSNLYLDTLAYNFYWRLKSTILSFADRVYYGLEE